MKGTTSALHVIFGAELGADHDGEMINVNGERIHIYGAFSLLNFLSCTALPEMQTEKVSARRGSESGQASREMWENCARHVRCALQILDPTLVIVQGHGVADAMASSGLGSGRNGEILERVEFKVGSTALVAKFTHPCARWSQNWGTNDSTPYLLKTVQPTIIRGLEMLGII